MEQPSRGDALKPKPRFFFVEQIALLLIATTFGVAHLAGFQVTSLEAPIKT